jgi:DNA polymerase III sliding clamp (beta) subunit (PCNA family)
MKSKNLSIVVSKKDLDLVVGRASLAAMSEEGQNEFSRASNETIGCVKISAENGQIVFESSVTRFSSRYVLTVGNGDAAIISEGETCIPAKELKAVASKIRSDRKISIVFVATDKDTTLNMSMAEKAVLPDGVVEIGSISGSKVVSKTKIEAYPAFQFASPQYPDTSLLKVVAEGKIGLFKKACSTVGFSVNTSSLNEAYDKFALFTDEDGIYFVGSDGIRCAIVKALGDTFDKYLNVPTTTPILADAVFMSPALASMPDDSSVIIGMDQEEQRLYICSGDTFYCINMVSEVIRAKYPKHKMITEMKTNVVVLINRDEISETMDLLGVVNNDRGKYTFDADKEEITLVGMGIGTVKETTGSIRYKLISEARMQSPSISLNTKYLSEGIKRMACENIRMSFSDNEKKVRIEDETDPSFLYFMQVMSTSEA